MDAAEFRIRGKEMVDYIADYLETIRKRDRIFPDVKPGYIRNLVPDSAPEQGEPWEKIFADVDRVIMPGVTHWQSPHMHAYFPALTSYPSILGEMLSVSLNNIGFTWAASPASTELESLVMDWLGKMVGLPETFLHTSPKSLGGGVIQTTMSEATLVSMFAAKKETLTCNMQSSPHLEQGHILSSLVAYASDQAHSSVEKAAMIAAVKFRLVETDEVDFKMKGTKFAEMIEEDKAAGLIPFFVCASLGTTGVCAFDDLTEIGPIAKKHGLWFHVDGAYAGSSFVCPENRYLMKGIELADSYAFNPSKNMLVNFDCTAMWIKDSSYLHRAFNVEPLYLQHENTGLAIDYMHWQVQLSRRFRALKLWFVIRNYGVAGIQKHIREQIRLAQYFEELLLNEKYFEIPAQRHLALVVFRLKDMDNQMTEVLLRRVNASGKTHCVPCSIKGKFVIRFCVTSPRTTDADIKKDFLIIKTFADELMKETDHGMRKPRLSFSAAEDSPQDKKRRGSLAHREEGMAWSATMETEGTSKHGTARGR